MFKLSLLLDPYLDKFLLEFGWVSSMKETCKLHQFLHIWCTVLVPICGQNLQILGIWEIQVLSYWHGVKDFVPCRGRHFYTSPGQREGLWRAWLTCNSWLTVTQKCERPFRAGAAVGCGVQVLTALQQRPGREVACFSRINVFCSVVVHSFQCPPNTRLSSAGAHRRNNQDFFY